MPPVEEIYAENLELKNELSVFKNEVASLRTQIAWLKQQLFGPGKSGKLEHAQLLLKLGELEKLVAPVQPVETISYERTKAEPQNARCPRKPSRTSR